MSESNVWMQLGMAAAVTFLIYLLYRQIKHQPQAFSAANLQRSLGVLGLLALGLIGFVALCIVLLRQG